MEAVKFADGAVDIVVWNNSFITLLIGKEVGKIDRNG